MAVDAGQHPLLIGAHGGAATIWRIPPADAAGGEGHIADLMRQLLPPAVPERTRQPLAQVLRVATQAGCRCVVVEQRYIDPDYRSEFSSFWSRRFEDRPAVARRLHFFSREIAVEELHGHPEDAEYLGYSVLRPTVLGPVGRTVIKPPPHLASAVLTVVCDRPNLFGTTHSVVGVPFCQQDGEFLVCAHTAAWLGHYVAQAAHIIGRRLSAEIASIPSPEGSKHRPLPSAGLTGEQLQAVFSAVGIPALFYDMHRLPRLPAGLRRGSRGRDWRGRRDKRERVLRVVCKYLNSGVPVVVLTEGGTGHAFTLVGWQDVGDHLRLVACDDQVGPYELIDDPLASRRKHRGPWRSLMVPLPEKVFFTGEAAEVRARNLPELTIERMKRLKVAVPPELEQLRSGLRWLNGPLSLRSRLMEGRRFKELVERQGRSPDVVRLVRMAHLPHWVWVVEMQDRAARRRTEPCVLAEWVFDSTAHDDVPREMLASTLSVSTDASPHGVAGPAGLYVARSSTGQPWRSVITDRTVDDRQYAAPAAPAPQ